VEFIAIGIVLETNIWSIHGDSAQNKEETSVPTHKLVIGKKATGTTLFQKETSGYGFLFLHHSKEPINYTFGTNL
jgi:hypothetical protein